MVEDGSAEDSTFFANYLHAKYVSDSTDATIIYFVSGEPITQGIFLYLGGSGNQTAPSVIEASEDASLIFKWVPGYTGAGLKYEDPVFNYRIIYLPFGLEGIDNPTGKMLDKFWSNVIEWFVIETDVDFKDILVETPNSCLLSQNYPNPFNNSTIIKYQIPEAGHVEIEIFNMLGQKIKRLLAKYQQQGFYQIKWKGEDDKGATVTSGIYMYRMKAGDFVTSNKLLYLK